MTSHDDDPRGGFDWQKAEQQLTNDDDGNVVELARRRKPADDGQDSHFDVALDDDSERTPAVPELVAEVAAPVETVAGGKRQIMPAALQNWANIKATVRHFAGLTGHRIGYHAIRSPWYAVQHAAYAGVGVFRLIGNSLRWWWLTEQHTLRQEAATANDPATWLKLHREVKATRMWRGAILTGGAVSVMCAGPALYQATPTWALTMTALGAVWGLSRLGRPVGKQIVGPAVVTPRFRRINADIVLRAYYAAGLGHPDKPDQEVRFGSNMARDASGTGSHVTIDLPYGKTFDHAMDRRGAIASGLDVSINQVFISPDKTSHRRHNLFVTDRDPLAIPAGRAPTLDGKQRDIWKPVPFGLDERGRLVGVPLMWQSVLVGAQPRKGKTFSARLLALYAALDPYVRIYVADAKNSPDWRKFVLVAHRIVFGTHPGPTGDPIDQLLDMLREIKKHIQDVNMFLSTLPVAECPDGKLTPELSRKYAQLRVTLLVMEEFQIYFETEDQQVNKEVANLLAFIQAVGPSAGVVIISSSQKPSGVGAGDVGRLFNRYRDNHPVRFALKCGNRNVSEAVLGSEAYGEGIDASTLPVGDEYRGVGYLYGLTDHTPTVRTYLADATDAEKILMAARGHRERLGLLTGQAAGQEAAKAVRDVLADVRSVFRPGENGLPWQEIAARLAEDLSEHYGDLNAAAISTQLRDFRVRSVSVKYDGQTLRGAKLSEIDTAIGRRDAA